MKTMIILLLVFAMCFTAACGGAEEGVSSASAPENSVESTSDSTEISDTESIPEASAPEGSESNEESESTLLSDPDYGYGTLPVAVNVESKTENPIVEGLKYNSTVAKHFTFHDALVSYYLTYRETFDLDAEDGFAAKMAKYNDSYFEDKALIVLLFYSAPLTELTVESVLQNADGGIDMELCSYIAPENYGGKAFRYYFVELPEGVGTEENTEISLNIRRDYYENYDPTRRPVVSADRWEALNPSEGYPVEYQYWSGTYVGCENDSQNVAVVRSVEELEEYRNPEKYGYKMLHAIKRYDEEYFKEQVLIIVFIFEGSGTPRHKPLSAYPNDKGGITLKLCEYFSGWGTCDLAEWTMLIEPMKGLKVDSANKVDIKWTHDYLENYVPEYPVYHDYAKVEQVKDGVGTEYTEDVEVTVGYSYNAEQRLIKGADAAEMATLLASLDYKAEEVCRCPATVQISFDGRVYHAQWQGNNFIRCDDGQVAVTEAQVKRLLEIIREGDVIVEADAGIGE